MSVIDEARSVRKGDELDLKAVDLYLRERIPGLQGVPHVKQFPGGASNLTYLVSYENRDLILRRPPVGRKAKGAHDMVREAKIMQALQPVYPYVPAVLALCQDESVLGADFYVMERLVGVIPRQDFPPALQLTPEKTRQVCLDVIDKLVELHKVDVKAAGLEALGKGEGYVNRQISGWTERLRAAHTPDNRDFAEVIAWLEAKKPAGEVAITVIHNDFRFDNVVLAPDDLRVIGVLDWELATLGDPLMDLGNSLAYWVQADDDPVFQMMRRQPTNAPGMLTRQEVVDYYGERTGWRVDNFDFYAVYGYFRLAGIAQQIWYRYYHQQTSNPAFATFGPMVNYLEQRCLKMIEASRL
ncbi:MAG: aminoglycoside phosphotransferase [Moraxellaceae bacterium]|jgi:aminoglycoside phosphotransferase (APT) family kinase protein|nr:aminoglycoside phosphotransferase [Moraxellaceae bacterium]